MGAYVEAIQREERKHGVETLTHQKWSGSELVDELCQIVSGGTSSTGIMSAGVTEKQFYTGFECTFCLRFFAALNSVCSYFFLVWPPSLRQATQSVTWGCPQIVVFVVFAVSI